MEIRLGALLSSRLVTRFDNISDASCIQASLFGADSQEILEG